MHSFTVIASDSDYIFVWKPSGRASSRGSSFSLLDAIDEQTDPLWIGQRKIFGHDDEYGLLNRLDNETTGIVIFARSIAAKENYHKLQDEGKVTKTYYATVYGQIQGEFGWIQAPLYHHRDDPSRMTTDPEKGRGQAQEATTYWERVGKDERENKSMKDGKLSISHSPYLSFLKIQIEVGCRHQIRCHLASIGHPIIGDALYTGDFWKKYCKKRNISLSSSLDLVSAGIEIA